MKYSDTKKGSLATLRVDGNDYQIWYKIENDRTDGIHPLPPLHTMEYDGTAVEGETFTEAIAKLREVIRNSVGSI